MLNPWPEMEWVLGVSRASSRLENRKEWAQG